MSHNEFIQLLFIGLAIELFAKMLDMNLLLLTC